MAGRTSRVWNENPKTRAVNLLLKNISWKNEREPVTGDVRVKDGVISEIGYGLAPNKKETPIDFKDHFLYPGLINSHDHLEMNLYPLMGKPPYQNYTEWAKDIYKPKESPIKEIESVDIKDRLLWGGIKNLISGVTTVVHHNPSHRMLTKRDFPVRVVETAWAHSLAFEKSIEKKSLKKGPPFVIHAAEGTDEFAQNEIDKLKELGLLKENTVLIHAVGLNKQNTKLIEQANSSIVWCPSSNFFMFAKTLPLREIVNKVKVALGSDSAMTGPATLLDEMRAAQNSGLASASEIYEMVTEIPARIFQVETPQIEIGKAADFWIAPANNDDYLNNIFKIGPAGINGVFVDGEMRFGDLDLAAKLAAKGFQFQVQREVKWCAYNIPALQKRIATKTNGACSENSLWKLFS